MRLTVTVLAAALLVGGTACGGRVGDRRTPAGSSTGESSPTRETEPLDVAGFSDYTTAGKPTTLTESFAVFRRPSTQADASVRAMAVDELSHGSTSPLLLDRARLLVGTSSEPELYAVPTADGGVCYALVEIGSDCSSPVRDGLAISGSLSSETGLVAYMFVPDGIVGARLVVDGQTHDGEIGENGVVLRAPEARRIAGAKVLVRHGDGTVTELPLH
jgi:hypothetical protein